MDKRDFFISFNSADKDRAEWVATTLQKNGYTVYFQVWDILTGDNFVSKMNEFLTHSEAFISIVSQNYINSVFCQAEFDAALKKYWTEGYRLIPVRVADVKLPELAQTIVFIDIFDIYNVEAEKRLLDGVREEIARSSTSSSNLPKDNNITARNSLFSGRERKLEDIHTAFNEGKMMQTIVGPSGVGKTQLALEYAHRFGHEYAGAVWVNAKTLHGADLLKVAKKSKLFLDGVTDGEFIKSLNKWSDKNEVFLLIFDNVEDAKDIERFTLHIKRSHVFIITRNKNLDLPDTTFVELDVFDGEDARIFMHKCLSEKDIGDEKTLNDLIECLGCFPLALAQAAAFIVDRDNNCDCSHYLELFSDHGLQIFEIEAAKPKDYNEIVTTVWEISFEKCDESAKQLFYLCSYMAPDNISLNFFKEQMNALPTPLRNELTLSENRDLSMNNIVQNLTKNALAKRAGNFVSIHPLVQEVVRHKLAEAKDSQWLSYCFTMAYDEIITYKYGFTPSMNAFAQNILHILEIASHAQIILHDQESQVKIAELFHKAGDGFEYSGRYQEALKWYQKALDLREQILGPEHQDTATTYNSLAGVYSKQGYFLKALEWYEKTLAIFEKTQNDLDTATTYNNIAGIYIFQAKNAEALKLHEKALAIFENAQDQKGIATTYNGMGEVCFHQGYFSRAQNYFYKALPIRMKILGPKHPDTAATYYNIGYSLSFQGQNTKALEWYLKALPIQEQVLGPDHPDTAITYRNISTCYSLKGNQTKGLEYLEKALAICETALPDHPYTAITYCCVALAHNHSERGVNGIWIEKGLDLSEKLVGPDHMYTIIACYFVATFQFSSGNFYKALKLFWKCWKSYRALRKRDEIRPIFGSW